MDSTVIGVLLACVASCLFNGGIALQALEAREAPKEEGLKLSLIGGLLRRPRWLAGTALNALALPVQTVALLLAPLTAVQPADATGLLLLLFLGSHVLGERVGVVELGAVLAIVGGIGTLTLSAPHRHVTHVGAADVLVPLLVVAAVALLPIVLRSVVGPDSIVVVVGAGSAFALTAFAIKLAADAIDRSAWGPLVLILAVAGAGALAGMLCEQTALGRRPATQVAPVIFVIELLVPVGLAVLVVGEDWQGSVPLIMLALTLTVGGAVALTRAPTVAKLLG